MQSRKWRAGREPQTSWLPVPSFMSHGICLWLCMSQIIPGGSSDIENLQGRWRSTSICDPAHSKAHTHTFITRSFCRLQSPNQFVSLLLRGHLNWLQLDRRVLEHDFPKKSGPVVLYFCVRYVSVSILLLLLFFVQKSLGGLHGYRKGGSSLSWSIANGRGHSIATFPVDVTLSVQGMSVPVRGHTCLCSCARMLVRNEDSGPFLGAYILNWASYNNTNP